MGGGVSLGSFSGSALTEALKLLILDGQDKEGNPYDEIVVDGMSGASAGAMALTILLKCLIDYKSMIPLITNLSEDDLFKTLAIDYFRGNSEAASSFNKIEELKALQLAQLIQKELWVNRVNSNDLFGAKIKKDYNKSIHDSFGLLDRNLLENLVKEFLINPRISPINQVNPSNNVIKILDQNRVLFACSLTNLLPIEVGNNSARLNKLEENVMQSVGSQNHSEIRVIDFVFNEDNISKPSDKRWLKFTANPDSNNRTHFDINNKESWSVISASALACGAFPIAFEPVLLKRYESEFGLRKRRSEWPKSFRDIQDEVAKARDGEVAFNKNSFFAEEGDSLMDYSSFNFPYIDGGTFNNEPIKEAFKIGAFQDFGRAHENFDRLVLFVDPIVRKELHHSFKLASFSPIKASGLNYEPKSELSKLTGIASSIIGALANQGSVKEEHKISDVKENFKLRNTIFKYLNNNENMGTNLSVEILKTAFDKIQRNLEDDVLSKGTRDPIAYFQNEIIKYCGHEEAASDFCLHISEDSLRSLKEKIISGEINDNNFDAVYEILNIGNNTIAQNTFAQSVFKIIIDFALNTDGKNVAAERVAVIPISTDLEVISLPGEEIQAFGGFASKASREYAFEYARLSTLLSLCETDEGFRKPVITDAEENKVIFPFIKDIRKEQLKKSIIQNVNKINFYADNRKYSKDLNLNLFQLAVKRLRGIILSNKILSFFALKMPFFGTALLGSVLLPVSFIGSFFTKSIKLSDINGGKILKNLVNNAANQIQYMTLEPVTISILSNEKLTTKFKITCEDESLKKVVAIKDDFKDFSENKRYQYLVQFYQILYFEEGETLAPKMMSSKMSALSGEGIDIARMGLSLSNKVKLPNGIDGNLDPTQKQQQIQANYTNIVDKIRIKSYVLPSITETINDKTNMLHYSFKNIKYHLNPMLQFDINNFEKGWCFIEQTESLDKKMLRD